MKIDLKLFTQKEIIETYEKYVIKDQQYYQKVNKRYKKLTEKQKERIENSDFPRVASLFDFEDWIKKYNLNKK